MHVRRKDALDFDDMDGDRDRGRPRVPRARGSRRSATAASRAPRRSRPPRPGSARSSTWRSSAATRPRSTASTSSRARRAGVSPTASGSASRPTRRTPARSRSTSLRGARAAAGHALRRERRRARLARRRARATGRRSPTCSCRPPARRGSGCSRRQGCSARTYGGPLRARRRRGDRAARRARRRRRALPPLERLPRLRRRPARTSSGAGSSRRGSAPTAPPRRPRSTCSRRSAQRSSRARARRNAPRRAHRPPLRSSSPPSAVHACSASTPTIGSLVPGKQADLAVISLEDSPFDPSKILLRQPSWVALPSASQLLWWPANSATGKERPHGPIRQEQHEAPEAGCCRSGLPPDPHAQALDGASIEDTMFFPRLRRHAKWMFVFLAIALGGGFVLFGVGAGGTGVGDIFRGTGGSSGVPSISRRARRPRRPEERAGLADLSTALQTDGQTDEAIAALSQAVALTPKDAGCARARRPLLSLSGRSSARRRSSSTGRPTRRPGESPACSRRRRSVVDDKIARPSGAVQHRVTAATVAAQEASLRGREGYKRIAKLQPTDPNVQLELAQAAQQAGDTPGDRRLREVPRAGTRRPERVDREAAAEGPEGGRRAGLDSPEQDRDSLARIPVTRRSLKSAGAGRGRTVSAVGQTSGSPG